MDIHNAFVHVPQRGITEHNAGHTIVNIMAVIYIHVEPTKQAVWWKQFIKQFNTQCFNHICKWNHACTSYDSHSLVRNNNYGQL